MSAAGRFGAPALVVLLVFVAFAPVSAPRYAVSVVVEHGGGGSRAAAPIAKDLLIETQTRDPAGPRAMLVSPASSGRPDVLGRTGVPGPAGQEPRRARLADGPTGVAVYPAGRPNMP